MAQLLRLAVLSALFALVQAQKTTSDGTRIIAGYNPEIYLSVIGIALYGISGALHWIHWERNQNNRYMLTLTIGMTCMVIGFILRIAYRGALDSIGIYAVMTLFILLSPCAFLATNYMLLTRLARALNAESALLIRASLVVKIFVWSDVGTFFLQAAGGGLSSSEGSADLGHKIALVGIALQLVSYCLFSILLIFFGLRVTRLFPHLRDPHPEKFSSPFATNSLSNWRFLWILMLISSVGIIIRSIFRLVEYTQGYDGYIPTHEAYFYLFDALPLWIAMSLYSIFWPPRFIQGAEVINGRQVSRGGDSGLESGSPVSTNEFKLVQQNESGYYDRGYNQRR